MLSRYKVATSHWYIKINKLRHPQGVKKHIVYNHLLLGYIVRILLGNDTILFMFIAHVLRFAVNGKFLLNLFCRKRRRVRVAVYSRHLANNREFKQRKWSLQQGVSNNIVKIKEYKTQKWSLVSFLLSLPDRTCKHLLCS